MSPRPRLVLATTNPGKVTELSDLLGEHFAVEGRPAGVEDVAETADTLEGNARLKAAVVAEACDAAALADDTGLEVDVLGGAPGVRSARFAGPDGDDAANVALLLDRLAGAADRRARFRTVLVLHRPDRGRPTVVHGTVEGTIATGPRGEGGFGYDPVFVPEEGDGRTFAEMDLADKAAISHRGRAARALLRALEHPADPG